jgi:hypothetical protein
MHHCRRAQEWFGINCFSPNNLPQVATYIFIDIVVSIASHPQNFNIWALSSPAIECDHQSYDLDGASGLTSEICLFQNNDSDLVIPNRTVDIYFGSLPRIHRFMPPALWIRRLTFTSGLYPGSTDLHHMLFRSNGSDLPRTI